MANLATYQAYADKCADKLGMEEKPVLRWAGGELGCRLHARVYAHCHMANNIFRPRGTICLSHKWFAGFSVKEWHHCIAHEVAHLAVKSAHRTPTFDRRLVTLGVANDSERRNARSAGKGHHHLWEDWWERDSGYFKKCRVCHRKKV